MKKEANIYIGLVLLLIVVSSLWWIYDTKTKLESILAAREQVAAVYEANTSYNQKWFNEVDTLVSLGYLKLNPEVLLEWNLEIQGRDLIVATSTYESPLGPDTQVTYDIKSGLFDFVGPSLLTKRFREQEKRQLRKTLY